MNNKIEQEHYVGIGLVYQRRDGHWVVCVPDDGADTNDIPVKEMSTNEIKDYLTELQNVVNILSEEVKTRG